MYKQAFQRAASTSTRRAASKPASSLLLFAGAGGAAIALAPIRLPIRCEPATTSAARPYAEPHTPAVQGPGSSRIAPRNDLPPVESSLDLRSLSFGAVAGISTGIFVKKGLKAVGFLLGGAFVFLQVCARVCQSAAVARLMSTFLRAVHGRPRHGQRRLEVNG
jgi:hypothetical protein